MDGMLVAWSADELQAIDEENFSEVVVDVVERFFDDVDDAASVTVIWETETRSHGTRYHVEAPPQLGLDSCFVDIEGTRGGAYRVELEPDSLAIRQYSNDWVEELTYLEFKATGVAIDTDTNTIALAEIPNRLKKQAIRAAPDIEW